MKKTFLIAVGLISYIPLAKAQAPSPWMTNGNAPATTDFIGTVGTQSLSIRTNSAERINIDPKGFFRFDGQYTSSNPRYNFNGNETETFVITNITQLHDDGNYPKPYDIFKVQTQNPQQVPSIPSSFLKVINSGNIGINTEAPQEKLHINNGILRLSGANSSGGPMIQFGGNPTTQSADWAIEYGVSTTTPSLHGLNFWKPYGSTNFGNYFLFLADNGNVGIGTDNPAGQFKLAVEGKIGAREIQVTTAAWADYVFENIYKKADLTEVEKYIKENKHLPGIPSSKEIKENGGIELGAMQVKQMEKIEEIYLYMIDLKKENEKLQERIIELEKK